MIKRLLTSILILLLGAQTAMAQCGPGETELRLEIDPDTYWYEVSWKITNLQGNIVYFQGQTDGDLLQTFTYCVPESACTSFRIFDSYGDGMAPNGIYRLYVNDVLYYENLGVNYGFGETVNFDCPPGTNCSNPLVLATGAHTTPSDQEVWYSFTPQDTGTYLISTCNGASSLSCQTKIWVYEMCQGITITNNNLGTIFYADGGCDNMSFGAEAELYLAGGKEYFIRIAYADGSCNGAPIDFTLNYEGPVVGCTDPLACNYQPLATVNDTCIYPGDPNCNDLPDLVVMENVLQNSFTPDLLVNVDNCAVEEGCVRGFGNRFVVRFTTHIKNIGVADYFIGQTPATPSTPSDQFVWDPCHNHWHYRGYAEYVLFKPDGTRVPIGSKNGFCVLDLECSGGGQGKYSCGNMGITAGCGDIYDASLPCQWIDLTGVEAGTYTLVVRVNWDKSPDKTGRHEVSYDNNWGQVCFELSYDQIGNPSVEQVNDCPQFTDCNGVVFGDAQPDCNGVCNGPALIGDWNQDTVRNLPDVDQYLLAALDGSAAVNTCNEIYENGLIDIYDAALLQECILHGDDPQYWGTRFACLFPTGTENPEDIVYLLPGTLDTVAKTFDVRIVNPYYKLLGFEFSISGLSISSLENIGGDFNTPWQFDPASGKVLALAANEIALGKNILPTGFLRVHYSALTDPLVCISNITTVVNEKYQRSNALLADPNCVSTGITAIYDPEGAPFEAFAMPNPAADHFTVFFRNTQLAPATLILSDAAGRPVRRIAGVRSESIVVERGDLPAGLYQYSIQTEAGRAVGKIVLK